MYIVSKNMKPPDGVLKATFPLTILALPGLAPPSQRGQLEEWSEVKYEGKAGQVPPELQHQRHQSVISRLNYTGSLSKS